MKKWFKEILFTRKEIEAKCLELSQWADKTYQHSNDLIIIGLLKGSIPFLAQLIKEINVNHELDFMTVSSFEGKVKSSGNLKIIMDLKIDIYNKDVLIVEDIIDSGLTLSKVIEQLKTRNPNSIKTLTLFDKKEGRKTFFQVDKFGFNVPNKFLVGFGLDVKGKLRNIPFVGVFDQSKIHEI